MMGKVSRLFLSIIMTFGVLQTPVYAEEETVPPEEIEEKAEETIEEEEVTETVEEEPEKVTEEEPTKEAIPEENKEEIIEVLENDPEKEETATEEELIPEEKEKELTAESEKVTETEKRASEGLEDSQAYAVLTDEGELIFFRSLETYNNHRSGTCTDIDGDEFKGIVYSNIENLYSWGAPWYDEKTQIKSVKVVEGQTITPTYMKAWFYECYDVTSIDLTGFDTSNVTDMQYMFFNCSDLTFLDLSSFDTSSVTSMESMFEGCRSLTSLDVSSFETNNVTSMYFMFYNCSSLESLDLNSFDNGKVTNMGYMFSECSNLKSLDLGNFNTGNVIDMYRMFDNCSNLTILDLSSFDTSNVTNMNGMFSECSNLESLDLSSFNTSKVSNMRELFYDCSSITNLNLSSFDTGNVTTMRDMFSGCYSLASLDLSNFNTANVTDMDDMFRCGNLLKVTLGNKFEKWIDGNTLPYGKWENKEKNLILSSDELYDQYPNNADYYAGEWVYRESAAVLTSNGELIFFEIHDRLKEDFTGVVKDVNGTEYTGMIYTDVEHTSWNSSPWKKDNNLIKSVRVADGQTIQPTSMSRWFTGCSNLTSFNAKGFDTNNVTSMFSMFEACSKITNLDLSSFDTSKVTSMYFMFCGCSNLTDLDLSNFDTSCVTEMSMMFGGCVNLKSLDISSFDTINVMSMGSMFQCPSLVKIKLGDKFTKWIDLASLPDGNWKNQNLNLSLTSEKLYSQYPSKASTYAGWWTRKLSVSELLYPEEQNFTFNGKVQKPKIVNSYEATVTEGTDYTVTWSNASSKYVGEYTVTVTGKGYYTGKETYTYWINPKKITPTVTLSKTAYTFDGKAKKPGVTVKAGSASLTTANYTVTYASGRKDVGSYKVTVKLKGSYTGSKTVTFKINPKGTTLKSLSALSKGFTVNWNKQAAKMSTSYITGYQIELATDSKFTQNKKTITVSGYKNTSKKITGLLAKKKYYVRIRTYKTVNKVKYYSPWSAVKYVTTK